VFASGAIVSLAAAASREGHGRTPTSTSASGRLSLNGGPAEIASPDIVQVTIGRVEVRASLSSPAPPPRSVVREPAALTLDQYLRQRKGAGAR
jgi:hypothetical protein